MTIHPIYTQFFSNKLDDAELGASFDQWDDFQSTPLELRNGPQQSDFSIDKRTWGQTCWKVIMLVVKIVLFPWILFEGIRFIAHRMVMTPLYPAQSWIVKKYAVPFLQTAHLDSMRTNRTQDLTAKDYVVRHVRLEKEGTAFSGLLMGKPETLQNGKWVLQATGNMQPIETATGAAEEYQAIGYNVLLINGQGVGRSEGLATTHNLWEGQELGLSFLEQAIGAKRIVAAGFSLGGAVMANALTNHDCKTKEIDYLAISQMSFDTVTNVGRKIFEENSPCLFSVADCLAKVGDVEMDAVAASIKMIAMKIPQVIIQAGKDKTEFHHDSVIPHQATLGHRLHAENIVELKSFHYIPNGDHNRMPYEETKQAIVNWEQNSAVV